MCGNPTLHCLRSIESEPWRKTLGMPSWFDTISNVIYPNAFGDRGGSKIKFPTGRLLCQSFYKWPQQSVVNQTFERKAFCKRGHPVWQ